MAPFDGPRLGEIFAELGDSARELLRSDGVEDGDIELRCSVDLRYAGQIFDVELPLDGPIADEAGAAAVLERFDRRYDELFGEGAGFREAGIELLMVRVTGVGRNEPLALGDAAGGSDDTAAALKGQRPIAWEGHGRIETDTYDGDLLGAGAALTGPAVIELSHTSVVLHPGDRAEWRDAGTIEIGVAKAADAAPTPATAA